MFRALFIPKFILKFVQIYFLSFHMKISCSTNTQSSVVPLLYKFTKTCNCIYRIGYGSILASS